MFTSAFTTLFMLFTCTIGVPIKTSHLIASDNALILGEVENCSPQSSNVDLEVHYTQGIVSGDKQWHLSELPELSAAIKEALNTSPFLTWKDDWKKMNFDVDDSGTFEHTTKLEGVTVPPAKIFTIYQLVLFFGDYTYHSSKIWHVFEECPKFKLNHPSASSTSKGLSDQTLRIIIIVPTVIIVLALSIFLLYHRDAIIHWVEHFCTCKKSREYDTRPSLVYIVPIEDSVISKSPHSSPGPVGLLKTVKFLTDDLPPPYLHSVQSSNSVSELIPNDKKAKEQSKN